MEEGKGVPNNNRASTPLLCLPHGTRQRIFASFLLLALCLSCRCCDAIKTGRSIQILTPSNSSILSPPALGAHSMVANPDPSVEGFFVFGGSYANGSSSPELWEFSVQTGGLLSVVGEWNKLADSPVGGRMGHSAYSFVSDGCINIVIYGGAGSMSSPFSVELPVFTDVHVWRRAVTDKTGSGTWLSFTPPSGSAPAGRLGHSVVSPLGGDPRTGVVFGGFDGTTVRFNDLWNLTVQNSSYTWQQLSASSIPGLYYHSADLVGSDMIVVGGIGSLGNSVSQSFAVQLDSGNALVSKPAYPSNTGIAGHRSVATADGTVVVIGGLTSYNITPTLISDIYAFDSNNSLWSVLPFDAAIGSLNQRIFPGVAKVALLPPFASLERIYVYGGFSSADGSAPTNELFAFDILDEGNQTTAGSSEPLISSSALAVAFYNNTLELTTPGSSLPVLEIQFLEFIEEPYQPVNATTNVTLVGPSVAWPSESSFAIETFSDNEIEGFVATTTLSNGATLGLTGFLSSRSTSFSLGPNSTFTSNANAFKFALDISNWSYQNLSNTEFLDLKLLINIGGNRLQGGFIEEDKQGISRYLFCTTTSCTKWQIPGIVFADGVYEEFSHEVVAPQGSGIEVTFSFPPFQNSFTFDPEFTLSLPGTQFSYSSDADEVVRILVAVFMPVFFVLICIVCILGCVFARYQGKRYIADVPDDEEAEEMMRNYVDSSDSDNDRENGDEEDSEKGKEKDEREKEKSSSADD